MDDQLRRLVGEAVSATGTAAPRVLARWIMESRREAMETMLEVYVRRMFGWRAAWERSAAPAQSEPSPAKDLF